MAFPASPTVGDIYTTPRGQKYVYTVRGTWQQTTPFAGLPANSKGYLFNDGTGDFSFATPPGATQYRGATPPATGAVPGDTWYDTVNEILFLRVSDGTAAFWLDVSTSAGVSAATQTESDAGTRSDVYISPATLKSLKFPSISSPGIAVATAQALPGSNTVTRLTAFGTVTSNLTDPASSFAAGVLTIGAGDAGFWQFVLNGDKQHAAGNNLYIGVRKNAVLQQRTGGFAGTGAVASNNQSENVVAAFRVAAGDTVDFYAESNLAGNILAAFAGVRLGI